MCQRHIVGRIPRVSSENKEVLMLLTDDDDPL